MTDNVITHPAAIAIRLQQIADSLAEIHRSQAELYRKRKHAQTKLDALEVELTPADHWLGSNAEKRNLHREKTLRGNRTWMAFFSAFNRWDRQVVSLEELANALRSERRGLEWSLRSLIVNNDLTSGQIYFSDSEPGSDSGAIDDRTITDEITPEVPVGSSKAFINPGESGTIDDDFDVPF